MMVKWALASVAAFPLLLLGYCKVPATSCTAMWTDVKGGKLQAPINACLDEPDTLTVGGLEIARIGKHVYTVDRQKWRRPGGPVCMIGVGCFPIYDRPRKETRFQMVRLEGPVNLARLRSYLDDRFLSDGSVVFDSLHRVPPLEPALDPTQLRPALPGGVLPAHVTDGRWVLYDGRVLRGADPSTLDAVRIAFIVADGYPITLGALIRDQHAVFFGSQRIDDADPATFRLVHYGRDRLHPGGNRPTTGWIGLDRNNAWYLSSHTAEPLGLSPHRNRELRQELTRLRVKNQLEPADPILE